MELKITGIRTHETARGTITSITIDDGELSGFLETGHPAIAEKLTGPAPIELTIRRTVAAQGLQGPVDNPGDNPVEEAAEDVKDKPAG